MLLNTKKYSKSHSPFSALHINFYIATSVGHEQLNVESTS